MAYLLTCECGEQLPIEPRQAGEEITCHCGRQITAPTMREIRLLPSTGETTVAPRQSWSALQGGMFCGGLALALIGVLAFGFLAYQRTWFDTEKPALVYENIDAFYAQRTETPSQALELWNRMAEERLPKRDYTLGYEVARTLNYRNIWQSIVAGIVGALGLVLAIAAFFVTPPQPTRSRAKKPAPKQPVQP